MSRQHQQLTSLLNDLEAGLRQAGLWELGAPSAEALASTEPFAVDTLAFSQWLQFIFIARLRQMLAVQAPLPGACSVYPMAEESLKGLSAPTETLLAAIAAIDALLSEQPTLH